MQKEKLTIPVLAKPNGDQGCIIRNIFSLAERSLISVCGELFIYFKMFSKFKQVQVVIEIFFLLKKKKIE